MRSSSFVAAFRRILAIVRRMSAAIYRAIVIVLLALIYVVVLPWFALAMLVKGPRKSGWRRREDPHLASMDRLRSPF